MRFHTRKPLGSEAGILVFLFCFLGFFQKNTLDAQTLSCQSDSFCLSLTCTVQLHPSDFVLSGTGNAPFSLQLEDAQGNVLAGNLVTGAEAGQTLQATITDSLGNTCLAQAFIADTAAPRLVCQNLTLGNTPDSCGLQLDSLPILATLFSASPCANRNDVHFSWAFGTDSIGPYTKIPKGMHAIEYAYTDCGGNATCTAFLTVEDTQIPTARCRSNRTQLLNPDTLVIPASYFNVGSSDNCAPIGIEVRRTNSNFSNAVRFGCADAGGTHEVILRVFELSRPHFFDECSMMLTVQDLMPPTITCPPDVTVDCTYDYLNLSLLGAPFIQENCGLQPLQVAQLDTIDMCGTGSVTRTYTATDLWGNSASCVQHIAVETLTPFDGSSIVWPSNYSTTTAPSSLHPDSLPAPFNRPTWTPTPCSIVGASFTDEFYDISAPACYKIVRRWTIVDCCQNDHNNPNSGGIWKFTQILNVSDHTAPVLTAPADMTVSPGPGCSTPFVQMPIATATDASNKIIITNNSPFALSGGADASGSYPFGTHLVTFRALDGCGNIAQKTVKIVIRDEKAPTPVCKFGLSGNMTMMPNGYSLMIQAPAFDGGSYDNCTPSGSLNFKIKKSNSPLNPVDVLNFDCTEVGHQDVDLYVTDLKGNSSFCRTFIEVLDNMGMCQPTTTPPTPPTPVTASIAGCVMTHDGRKVRGVQVAFSTIIDTTDALGVFQLTDIQADTNNFLTPTCDENPMNGVDVRDMLAVQRHLLGIAPITSPYKLIAADANRSGDITPGDIVEMRKVLLGMKPGFSGGPSWRFVPKNHVFTHPSNPWAVAIPENVTWPNGLNVSDTVDFVAIKVGDVTDDATTNLGADLSDDRNEIETPELEIFLKNTALLTGQDYVFPVKTSHNDLAGLQMNFRFNPDLVEVIALDSDNSAGFFADAADANSSGEVALAWMEPESSQKSKDTPLFSITLRAKRDVATSEVFAISTKRLKSMAVNRNGQEFAPRLIFEKEMPRSQVHLMPNQPNPFRESTTLRVGLRGTSDLALLEVFDTQGRLIFSEKKTLDAGVNPWPIEGYVFPVPGTYTYRISTGGWSAVGRMTKIIINQ